ncbi:uncharacterized protein LOC125525204 [Triticum urartu]|uniref:Uncharacterized protein n=1 Tax=Triticum urartu TaxID=4572 RepID=A0A8R7V9N5_TRIUA|nr:uncharacterized protein LOC123148646 [Triticum aestivum]XP_048546171.1 uncharacterized protein LOC125525204 [Triticum urartu]
MMWVPSILPLPGCVHPLPPRLSRPRGAELENERSGCGEASKERARRDIGQGYSFVLLGKLQTGKWNMYRSAQSPLYLINRFAAMLDIGMILDTFVKEYLQSLGHVNFCIHLSLVI